MSYRPIGSIIKFSLLGDVIVKCFTMTSKNHFLFSNRLFQFFSNQRPDRNSRNQLFVFSAVVVYTLPFLVQMIKLLIAHIQLDHEKLTDKEELKIMKKYTVQNKSYTYILVVLFNVYCFLIIFPCIFNVLLHFNNKLEDKQLTLPLIENSIGNHGVLFYSMLLSQIIVIIIVEAVSCISFSPFFVFIQHACYQCSILILKIHQPFDKNHKSGKNVRYFYTQTEEYNWIIDIINRHQKSIECNIPFYTLSRNSQKLLIFMIAKSGKPIFLTIGNMFDLTYEVFAKVNNKIL
ncbi:hypothetical protein M0802_011821 [Mischocyttarus mexicanus]|nr:hypothetical protein M0802_011821 [Mischocyttarus mexicanus]